MSNFHVGQKVVCIGDEWIEFEPHLPKRGNVYTVREIEEDNGELFLRLVELVNPVRRYREYFGETTFDAVAFRPVVERKTSIAIFHEILNKTRTGVPA